ncbi:MAG: YHS domain-containing protein [candidate division WOR-3 bacterium]
MSQEPQVHIDPVCGMSVYENRSAGIWEYKGKTYYFCSTTCLNQFRENPE